MHIHFFERAQRPSPTILKQLLSVVVGDFDDPKFNEQKRDVEDAVPYNIFITKPTHHKDVWV